MGDINADGKLDLVAVGVSNYFTCTSYGYYGCYDGYNTFTKQAAVVLGNGLGGFALPLISHLGSGVGYSSLPRPGPRRPHRGRPARAGNYRQLLRHGDHRDQRWRLEPARGDQHFRRLDHRRGQRDTHGGLHRDDRRRPRDVTHSTTPRATTMHPLRPGSTTRPSRAACRFPPANRASRSPSRSSATRSTNTTSSSSSTSSMPRAGWSPTPRGPARSWTMTRARS